VVRDVGCGRWSNRAYLELFNHRSRGARASKDDPDTRGCQRLVSIGAAIAGQHDLNVFSRQQLSRLDSRATAQGDIGILDGLKFHGFRVDDEEVRAPAKARVYRRIQRSSGCRKSDFHGPISFTAAAFEALHHFASTSWTRTGAYASAPNSRQGLHRG